LIKKKRNEEKDPMEEVLELCAPWERTLWRIYQNVIKEAEGRNLEKRDSSQQDR